MPIDIASFAVTTLSVMCSSCAGHDCLSHMIGSSMLCAMVAISEGLNRLVLDTTDSFTSFFVLGSVRQLLLANRIKVLMQVVWFKLCGRVLLLVVGRSNLT